MTRNDGQPFQRNGPLPDSKSFGSRFTLRQLLEKLPVAHGTKHDLSFPWPNNYYPYSTAKLMGITIRTRKINGSGYLVWKVKEAVKKTAAAGVK